MSIWTPRPPVRRHPRQARDWRRTWSHNPGRTVVAGFASGIAIGTGLLMLPVATPGPGGATALEALFTATSALCVTGLAVVDTATDWSAFGQATILVLIQVGGFGIMTLASLLGLLISRQLGLSSRIVAAAETKSVGLGDVRAQIDENLAAQHAVPARKSLLSRCR